MIESKSSFPKTGCAIIIAAFIFVVACGVYIESLPKTEIPIPANIENIIRVFYNGSSEYTLFIEDPDTKEVNNMKFPYYYHMALKIVADAPKDKKMWVSYEKIKIYNNEARLMPILHIHSGDDIQGGTTTGKYPKKINVIE